MSTRRAPCASPRAGGTLWHFGQPRCLVTNRIQPSRRSRGLRRGTRPRRAARRNRAWDRTRGASPRANVAEAIAYPQGRASRRPWWEVVYVRQQRARVEDELADARRPEHGDERWVARVGVRTRRPRPLLLVCNHPPKNILPKKKLGTEILGRIEIFSSRPDHVAKATTREETTSRSLRQHNRHARTTHPEQTPAPCSSDSLPASSSSTRFTCFS